MPDRTVFVVDDDAAVRNGLSFLLRTAGYTVRTFPSAQAFLDAYDPQQGGCLVLDVQMPSMTGLELQRELNRRGWRIPVIFITGHATVPLAVEAVRAGAFDLIEKPLPDNALLDRVGRALDTSDAEHESRLFRAQLEPSVASLTAREREVLALVASGESCKVIARRLGISFRTVETHRAHIIRKLHARSPADLVRLASMISFISPM